jgi:hypothetical protein
MRRVLLLLAAFLVISPATLASDNAHKGGSGSTSGSVPGLANGVGTDATLRYIETLPSAVPQVSNLPTFYFSAATNATCVGDLPQGVDATGDGTREHPFRSWGRALPLVQRGGVVLLFDACDTWSVNDAGGSGDNESAAFLLGASQRITIDTRAANGAHWRFCHDPDAACVVIGSTDLTGRQRPLIDPDMLDGTGANTGFFLFDSDPTDSRGWLHIENINFGTATHPFPRSTGCGASTDFIVYNSSPGRVSVLHSNIYICGNNNEVWTSHNSTTTEDFAVFVDVTCIVPDVGTDGNERCFWGISPTGQIHLGSRADFRNVNASAKSNIMVNTSPGSPNQANYAFIYDSLCDFRGIDADTLSDKKCFSLNGIGDFANSDTALQRMVVARSRCMGGGTGAATGNGCLAPSPEVPSFVGLQEMVSFRNASYDQDAFFDIDGANPSPLNSLLLKSVCSVQYAGTNGTNRFFNQTHGVGTDCDELNFDVHKHLIEEGSAVVALVENVAYNTITGFCTTAPATQVCNIIGTPPNVWTRCDMTDLTADPFGTSGLQVGTCTTTQCDNDCDEDLLEVFRAGTYIPRYLVDGTNKILGVALAGVGQPIGP